MRLLSTHILPVCLVLGAAVLSGCGKGSLYPPSEATVEERQAHAKRMSEAVEVLEWEARKGDETPPSPLGTAIILPAERIQLTGRFRVTDPSLPAPPHVIINIVGRKKDGGRLIFSSTAASVAQLESGVYEFSGETKAPSIAGTYKVEANYQGNVFDDQTVTVGSRSVK